MTIDEYIIYYKTSMENKNSDIIARTRKGG